MKETKEVLFDHRHEYPAILRIGHQTATRRTVHHAPEPFWKPVDRSPPQVYKWTECGVSLPPPCSSGQVSIACPECGEAIQLTVGEWYDAKQHGPGCGLMIVAILFGGLSWTGLEGKSAILAMCSCVALFALGGYAQSRHSRKYRLVRDQRMGLPIKSFGDRKIGVEGSMNNQTADQRHAIDSEVCVKEAELVRIQ